MKNFKKEVNKFEPLNMKHLEIDWVIRETTRIKLLPHRYEFIEEEKDIYYKSMVPMIYAYLEGFVKNAIRIYMKFVLLIRHKEKLLH